MTSTASAPTRWAVLTAAVRARLGIPPPVDEAFKDAVAAAIGRAEAGCGAEIVLVVRPASGSYRDVCWLVGALAAWLALLAILFSEVTVSPTVVPTELLAVFFFAAWLCHSTAMRRWFVSRERLDRQAVDGARVALFKESILTTPAGTGILVYWSRLERRVEALADRGIHSKLPPVVWRKFVAALRAAERAADPRIPILQAIANLGERLARHVPIPPGHVRVLPDRPRGES